MTDRTTLLVARVVLLLALSAVAYQRPTLPTTTLAAVGVLVGLWAAERVEEAFATENYDAWFPIWKAPFVDGGEIQEDRPEAVDTWSWFKPMIAIEDGGDDEPAPAPFSNGAGDIGNDAAATFLSEGIVAPSHFEHVKARLDDDV